MLALAKFRETMTSPKVGETVRVPSELSTEVTLPTPPHDPQTIEDAFEVKHSPFDPLASLALLLPL